MASHTLNQRAFQLRTKLFELTNEFKTLESLIGYCEASPEERAKLQANCQVGCQLAAIYEDLPDLFVDAASDEKDQSYPWLISEEAFA